MDHITTKTARPPEEPPSGRAAYDDKMARLNEETISNIKSRKTSKPLTDEEPKPSPIPGGIDPEEPPTPPPEESNDQQANLPEEKIEFKREDTDDMSNEILYHFPSANGPSNVSPNDEPIRPKFPTFPIDPSKGEKLIQRNIIIIYSCIL